VGKTFARKNWIEDPSEDEEQYSEFVAHRHDQSLFTLIGYIRGITVVKN
jgi:hypothetical protein